MRRRWRWLLGLGCVALLVIGPCRYGYVSVCSECGAIRGTDSRVLPLVPVPYWTRQEMEETLVSRLCAEMQLVGDHEHAWQFIHGNSWPLWSCGVGRGSLVMGQVNSEHIATFLRNVAEFGSVEEAQKWLRLVLDADTSRFVSGALPMERFPEAGFETADEYRQWSAARMSKMETLVHELAKKAQ